MAYRRQYKKRGYKKRSMYRKKSRYGGRKYIKRKMKAQTRTVGTFMPDRYFTKLKYSYFRVVSDLPASGGTKATIEFRGNSLYDPDDSIGTGQAQPLGFDQLVQFYGRYRVYASKIYIKMHSLSGTGTTPYYLAIVPRLKAGSFLTSPDIEVISEQPYSRYITRNQYDSNRSIKSIMSTAKIFGVSKVSVKTDDSYSAGVNTNPIAEWLWSISYGTLNRNLSVTPIEYSMEIKITYYSEFYERKNLVRS